MNISEILNQFIELLHKSQLKNCTNIFDVVPENPSYPYIRVGVYEVYNFSTFVDDLCKMQIIFERCSLNSEEQCIDELTKIKDIIENYNESLENWKILHKKFNKISLKQDRGISYGSVNFEFLIKKI